MIDILQKSWKGLVAYSTYKDLDKTPIRRPSEPPWAGEPAGKLFKYLYVGSQ